MRRIFALGLAALLVGSIAPLGHADSNVLALARVKVTSQEQGNYLVNNFDETHNHRPGRVELLLWPGDRARLDALGYRYDIVQPDVYKHDMELFANTVPVMVPLPGPDRTDYRVLEDYNAELIELAEKNPGLVKLLTLPHQTLEGRDVLGVEIANNVKSSDGRPTLYVDGIHHAREWPAAEYPMIFAHYLVEKFGKDPAVTRLLKQGRVVIVPIVNPDGFSYSRNSLLGTRVSGGQPDAAVGAACGVAHCESYWRKNRRSYTGVTVPVAQRNPDAYGVDPNRNYSYHWGGGGSTGANATTGLPMPGADQTYRGAGPLSEPETQNVTDLLLSRNATAIVSNHTSGKLVLRAWGDTYVNAPDEKYLSTLGGKMAKAMGGYQNIKGIQLYVTTGTMSDWGYGVLGVPSYTFEHGTSFHPPYTGCQADCIEKQWPGVMKAYMTLGDAALDTKAHGVIKGRVAGGAAKLTITKKFGTPLTPGNPLNEKVYTETIKTTMKTAANGTFEWHLPPSTRPAVRFKGGLEKYTLTISGAGGTKKLTFVLKLGQTLNLGTIQL